MKVEIQWLAILAGVAVNMIIGFIWYGPMFAQAWMKLVGKTEKKLQANAQVTYSTAIILAAVQVFALRHFIVFAGNFYPNYSPLSVGLITGWWTWLGFVMPAMVMSYMFADRPKKLIMIDVGYHLVVLLINGAILALWT